MSPQATWQCLLQMSTGSEQPGFMHMRCMHHSLCLTNTESTWNIQSCDIPCNCFCHSCRVHCRNNSRGALTSAKSARKSLIRVCGSQHLWVAGASREMAESHVATGKDSLQQAEDLCQEAYLVAKHQAPPEHMHAALTSHVLAAAQASAQKGDRVVSETLR